MAMETSEKIFGIIAIVFGVIAIGVLIWGFTKYPTEKACGERFVLDEFPIFGITNLKPITLLVYSAFICWMCGLESLRFYLSKLPFPIKRLAFVAFFFFVFVYSYEVIWNFFAWSEAYILEGGKIHIDLIQHLLTQTNPKAPCPNNLVYTTKTQFLFLASSLYGVYFFHEIMKNFKKKNSK